MDAKDLINYKALSRMVTDNDNSIRRNKCPKKYKEKLHELESLINYCIYKWHQ